MMHRFFLKQVDRKLHSGEAQLRRANRRHSQVARALPLARKQSVHAQGDSNTLSMCTSVSPWPAPPQWRTPVPGDP